MERRLQINGCNAKPTWIPGDNEHAYRLSPTVEKVVAVIPVLIVLLFSILWLAPEGRHFFEWMMEENHPVELLTFASLLIAGIMGLQLSRISWLRTGVDITSSFYAVFSIGLIIVAMEEISWGQWFFGFGTPTSIAEINRQGELNFHNIPVVTEAFEVLRLAFGAGGLLGIWLSTQQRTVTIGAPRVLSSWFVLIAVLAFLDLCNVFIPRDQRPLLLRYAAAMPEVLELLIGLSACLYMWLNTRLLSFNWKQVAVAPA